MMNPTDRLTQRLRTKLKELELEHADLSSLMNLVVRTVQGKSHIWINQSDHSIDQYQCVSSTVEAASICLISLTHQLRDWMSKNGIAETDSHVTSSSFDSLEDYPSDWLFGSGPTSEEIKTFKEAKRLAKSDPETQEDEDWRKHVGSLEGRIKLDMTSLKDRQLALENKFTSDDAAFKSLEERICCLEEGGSPDDTTFKAVEQKLNATEQTVINITSSIPPLQEKLASLENTLAANATDNLINKLGDLKESLEKEKASISARFHDVEEKVGKIEDQKIGSLKEKIAHLETNKIRSLENKMQHTEKKMSEYELKKLKETETKLKEIENDKLPSIEKKVLEIDHKTESIKEQLNQLEIEHKIKENLDQARPQQSTAQESVVDEDNIQLGPGGGMNRFIMWGRGSFGSQQPAQEQERSNPAGNK